MKRNFFWIFLGLNFLICSSGIAQQQANLLLGSPHPNLRISKNLYGMFCEHLGRDIYQGIYVGRSSSIPNQDGIRLDIVQALKNIHLPVLRWPGGCFADTYHWRDGIGPRASRPAMVNVNWGNVSENNHFGTAEFMELCHLVGCQPYIAGNMGSGTVQEMSQWVEYLNSNLTSSITELRRKNGRNRPWKVNFWGVGNESWGCGGNMTPEYYCDLFKRYATFCRNYPGAPLKKIASGPNADDTHWMEVLMKNIPSSMMWGISLHYYTLPTGHWGHKGSATHFNEQDYFNTLKNALQMNQVIRDQETIMDQYDPLKKIALAVDEWGIWTDPEPDTNPAFLYQQNSLRDALAAASTLNIFNNHCDRVKMANLAQTVNVLQAVILTKGKRMILTPTYYVFDLYQVHQGATYLPIKISSPDYVVDGQHLPAVNASASQDSTGTVHISLVNIDASKSVIIRTTLTGVQGDHIQGKILTSKKFTDVNTFNHPHLVMPAVFTGFQLENKNQLVVTLPPKSLVVLALK
ncbi:MAG: alpha-N-arabinofuranosidase [Chitinophagaceae bacterium]